MGCNASKRRRIPSTPRSSKWSVSLRPHHEHPACTSPVSHTCHMPCGYHSSWFDHPNNIWWEVQSIKQYRALSPSLCGLLHYPVISSLVGTNTFLRTLLAITLNYASPRILRKELQDCGEEEATLGPSHYELHAAKYLQFPFKLPTQQSPPTINTTVEWYGKGRNCWFV